MTQEPLSERNREAWSANAYEAWVRHMGPPSEQAARFKSDPHYPLRRYLKYIGNPAGKRILNPLGSHGGRAIPLAVLGAQLTVVDISEQNQRYALETAEAAGVELRYICNDLMNLPMSESLRHFDLVLMELGILHYFSDLDDLFLFLSDALCEGGRLLLTDFHPVSSKLFGGSGDYFDRSLTEDTVAYHELLPERERDALPRVLLRRWTIGEILSALARHGFYLRHFDEERSLENPHIPSFFNLVADKITGNLGPLIP